MPAPRRTRDEQGPLLLAALFFPALPALLLLTTFIEPKGLPWLAEILREEPLWLLWLTRVILAGLVVGACQFVSRPMLRQFWKNSRDLPDDDPSEAPEHQTVAALWVCTLMCPVFGGMLASVPLMASNVEGGVWSTIGTVLVVGCFFTIGALIMGVPRLEELHRRGAWVPPGTSRHPVLMLVALVLLIMAAVGAFMILGGWLLECLAS